MGTHLRRTHFILEGFAVAASRTLSARHPVAVLLRPHLRVLLWNNFEGRELLLSPNGFATQLMAGGLAGSAEIVKRCYAGVEVPPIAGIPRRDVPAWTIEDFDLPLSLQKRGVADSAALPDYPYRDDGLLVWQAVRDYVSSYLRLYYASDADVVDDTEIQAFVAELVDPAAGKVKGLSAPRVIDDLVTLLTRIVFTCGPQHAAVNFPQYDMAGFAPSMPAAAYAPPPQDPKAQSDAFHDGFLLQALPPPGQAELQVKTTFELVSYRFDKLGHYESDDFSDARALAVIAEFQKRLAGVTDTINARNAKRARPYPWFLPERITNSTSI
jgi:arachidonate 15-lipoxygenase